MVWNFAHTENFNQGYSHYAIDVRYSCLKPVFTVDDLYIEGEYEHDFVCVNVTLTCNV